MHVNVCIYKICMIKFKKSKWFLDSLLIHFLFNCLYSISHLFLVDNSLMTDDLSDNGDDSENYTHNMSVLNQNQRVLVSIYLNSHKS